MKFQIALPENDNKSRWKKKKDEDRFMTARHGDILCPPFQCDHCWFVNLCCREPSELSYSDERLLGYIRLVNLDLMWRRERGTVGNMLAAVNKGRTRSIELGMVLQLMKLGLWPLGDGQGFQTAIKMLRASQKKGKHYSNYVQFDTVRKIRTAYVTIYESSAAAGRHMSMFKGVHCNTFAVNQGSTDTYLFRKFMVGLEKRMGRLVIQNVGISVEVLLAMLEDMEVEYGQAATISERKRELIICGSAFVVLFSAALQGGEVLLGEASELVRRIMEGKHHANHPHVVFPMMGRFKGKTGERNLIFCLANSSNSGIHNRRWLERLARLLMLESRHKEAGPAFCDQEGFVVSSNFLNGELHKNLSNLQASRPDLIPQDIVITKAYNVYRSFRRSATTRAREAKVPKDIIELNNRWSKVERKSGGMPKMSMADLYTEIRQALATKLCFSKSL